MLVILFILERSLYNCVLHNLRKVNCYIWYAYIIFLFQQMDIDVEEERRRVMADEDDLIILYEMRQD